jgi:hypothetical protein
MTSKRIYCSRYGALAKRAAATPPARVLMLHIPVGEAAKPPHGACRRRHRRADDRGPDHPAHPQRLVAHAGRVTAPSGKPWHHPGRAAARRPGVRLQTRTRRPPEPGAGGPPLSGLRRLDSLGVSSVRKADSGSQSRVAIPGHPSRLLLKLRSAVPVGWPQGAHLRDGEPSRGAEARSGHRTRRS